MIKRTNKGFTLTELLTVVGIVAVLIALLLPALNKVRDMGFNMRQKGQITAIEIALEAYRTDFGYYPSSSNVDADAATYFGSEKLAEALLGYDLLGVNRNVHSLFDKDDTNNLYSDASGNPINLDQRKGPYLEADRMNPVPGASADSIFDLAAGGHYIADSFKRDGLKVGLPILYYRARPENAVQDGATVDDKVYDYRDCNMPFKGSLAGDKLAYTQGYDNIWGTSAASAEANFDNFIFNPAISTDSRKIPYRSQSFLLISAGADGIYGTADDICNFERN